MQLSVDWEMCFEVLYVVHLLLLRQSGMSGSRVLPPTIVLYRTIATRSSKVNKVEQHFTLLLYST
jgi:hypothetical protein